MYVSANITPPLSYSPATISGTVPANVTNNTAGVSGDWYIEEQSLDIWYWRQPIAELQSYSATLSSITCGTKIIGTQLLVMPNLTYRREKQLGTTYYTSAYQQPQRFELHSASSDSQGNSYGFVVSGSSGTLGPYGRIVTHQPYYKRVFWDDARHASLFPGGASSFTSRIPGGSIVNYYQNKEIVSNGVTTIIPSRAIPWASGAKWCIEGGEPGTFFLTPREAYPRVVGGFIELPGPYSTSQEERVFAWRLINEVTNSLMGADTSNSNWFNNFPNGHTTYSGNEPVPIATELMVSGYDPRRHQYT